jgi:predicted Zn finger-like uncharacterized protein
MNVQCAHCKTVFRVDPAKIPAGGVRARCSICRSVFEVAPPPSEDGRAASESTSAAPTLAPTPPRPVAVPTPTPAGMLGTAPRSAPGPTPTPTPEPQPRPAPEPGPSPTPTPRPTPTPTPSPTPSAARSAPSPFGASDPSAKARRLARALVSDIVTYFPDRRDQALAAGTLKKEFMEEIKKSWEEYVAQVGAEAARSTPHFREALNDILAKGQQVF